MDMKKKILIILALALFYITYLRYPKTNTFFTTSSYVQYQDEKMELNLLEHIICAKILNRRALINEYPACTKDYVLHFDNCETFYFTDCGGGMFVMGEEGNTVRLNPLEILILNRIVKKQIPNA